jgi:ribosome-binding factor A
VPDKRRVLRLQSLILEVAAETLQREARDPRIGFVSVTRVKLTPDLTQALVYWSALGDGDHRLTEKGLAAVRGLVQKRVAEALTTRVTPHLEFRFDPSLERAQRLESIFEHLRGEGTLPPQASEGGPPDRPCDPTPPPPPRD